MYCLKPSVHCVEVCNVVLILCCVWQIKIHTEPTSPGEHGHYNMEQDVWETNTLLEVVPL